jgi:hypothetical protein
MEPFFTDYLERLQRLHDDAKATLEGLPNWALDWLPGSDMNSLCVLAVHVTGAEQYWIGDVVARAPSNRDRASEFRTQGLVSATLLKRLDDSLVYVRGVLNGLSLRDLEAERISPRDGRRVTVGWSLAHTLSHTAVHVGHMQVTRQVWEQQGTR